MKNLITVLLFTIIAFSCQNTEEPTPFEPFKDMLSISSSATGIGAIKMDVYMNEAPFVGFNGVFVDVYDSISHERLSDWDLSFAPLMTMVMNGNTMKHTCPVEKPVFDEELKAFVGASVFVMPTTDMGMWEFEINYQNSAVEGSLKFEIMVVEKDNPALISFVSESNPAKKYFVALIEPSTPDVGINNFELGIYTKESMMSFPSTDEMTVTIEPEMPSMGHGSPDNVDPVSTGNGHYTGTVNFTMTGLWHVNMKIEEGSDMVALDKYFVIEF